MDCVIKKLCDSWISNCEAFGSRIINNEFYKCLVIDYEPILSWHRSVSTFITSDNCVGLKPAGFSPTRIVAGNRRRCLCCATSWRVDCFPLESHGLDVHRGKLGPRTFTIERRYVRECNDPAAKPGVSLCCRRTLGKLRCPIKLGRESCRFHKNPRVQHR